MLKEVNTASYLLRVCFLATSKEDNCLYVFYRLKFLSVKLISFMWGLMDSARGDLEMCESGEIAQLVKAPSW